MWKTDQLGLAAWRDDHSPWYLDARGGGCGIGMTDTDASGDDDFGQPGQLFSLSPVDQRTLPAAGEQFLRGDELHVIYPQGDGVYELQIVFRPIESRPQYLVLEATIAIQTDRLDTHPKLDLDVPCETIRSIVPADPSGYDEVGRGAAPISVTTSHDHSTCVLLGPNDSPFTSDHSSDSQLRLRLFGDFLEKGVIRKARPWMVLSHCELPPSETELQRWWKQLCESPLPLTSS